MGKFIKCLFRFTCLLAVVAVAAAGVFYFVRREHFLSFGDFIEELKDELSTLPILALIF